MAFVVCPLKTNADVLEWPRLVLLLFVVFQRLLSLCYAIYFTNSLVSLADNCSVVLIACF